MVTAADTSILRRLDLTPAEVKFYKNEGYLYLPGLVDPKRVHEMHEEVLDILEADGRPRDSWGASRGTADKLRQSSKYLRGSRLDDLINGEATRDLASRLIEGPANVYLPFTAVKAGGGGGRFDFHQDNQYTRHEPAMGSINIWVALVDMSPENGCLQVVPRSHLGGTLDSVAASPEDGHRKVAFEPDDFLPVRMRAGDAIAFTRLTVHGSGANHTDQARVAYALQFHRDDVQYLHKDSGQWKRLKDEPRWKNRAVESLE